MRSILFFVIIVGFLGALIWSVLQADSPDQADYTFCNGTEIKTIDPAQVTGSSEGRVILGLMEGLLGRDPKTLDPIQASAKCPPEISEDGKTYTFEIRDEACWSNGQPMTAHDFEYSWRRLLHPEIASQYAFQLFYIKGAQEFNSGTVKVGDSVEVETKIPVEGALPYADNQFIRGVLKRIDPEPTDEEDADAEEIEPTYFVEDAEGNTHAFRKGGPTDEQPDVQDYDWILYDFEKVAIKAIDDRHFQVELLSPCSYFQELMGLFALFPVNRECVETHGFPNWTRPENFVGNGPFTLEYRRLRDRLRMRKNPEYWNAENVKVDTIDVLASESATTNLNLYLTGACDMVTEVPEDIIRELRQRPDGDFEPRPFLATYYYIINTEEPPLDNVHIRRALSMALDRSEIVGKLKEAGEEPALGLTPSVMRDYTRLKDYDKVECAGFDPEQAAKEMELAGYPGGKGCPEIKVLYNTSEGHRAIAELIQAQWKRHLGINITLRNEEFGTYLNSRRENDFQIARAGWTADYPDPNTFLDLYVTDGPQNDTKWSNAEFDQLIKDAANEADSAKRLKILADAERILMEQLPIIPIYYYVDKEMFRPYVKGYYRNMENYHPLWSIEIDEEKKKEIFERDGIK